MLDEEKNVDLDNEKNEDADVDSEINSEETETSKNEASSDVDENDDKKQDEEDPYEKRLRELEAENKKKEEMLAQKNAALKEERTRRKQLEGKTTSEKSNDDLDKPLTKKEMLELMEERERKAEYRAKVEKLTENPTEQKLIQAYVEKGYNVDDAYVLANRHLIDEHKRMVSERQAEEELEGVMTHYSAGRPTGVKPGNKWENNPILRKAAEELDPEDRKYLNKI
jgi:hypothetical protein